jgi:hypothetical protein
MDALTARCVESIRSRVNDAKAQVKVVLEYAKREMSDHLLDAIASMNDALQICEGLRQEAKQRPRTVEQILLPFFDSTRELYGWTVDANYVFDHPVAGNVIPWIKVTARWEGPDKKPSGEETRYLIDLMGREVFEQLEEDAKGTKSMRSLGTF